MKDKIARVNNQKLGKEFEQEITETANYYEKQGWMALRKTFPPCQKIFIPGRGPIVIMRKDNPYLDFVGVWKERNGLAIFLEAKKTQDDRLKIGSETDTGGVTERQGESLELWRAFFAVTCVLWKSSEGTLLMRSEIISKIFPEYGRRHVRFSEVLKSWPEWCRVVKGIDFRPKMAEIW